MKKDIFNGKIKKEYFSYILAYMIFFFVLFLGVGIFVICCTVIGAAANPLHERIILIAVGVVFCLCAPVSLFLELLVIRQYPKYGKLRKHIYNSDIYFTDSTRAEYRGRRRDKAAFDIVTLFAAAEKGMGDKKPVRYKVYLVLSTVMCVLELAILFVLPILFEKGVVFPNVPDGVFAVCFLLSGFICIALSVFFFVRAFNVALMAPFEGTEWQHKLYVSLVEISVRQNNKKLKFWYTEDQLAQIEDLVKSASENAELKLETKRDKLISFTVVNTQNGRRVFTGLFVK